MVLCALVDNGQEIQSELNSPGVHWLGRQDFTFRFDTDQIYFIALPIRARITSQSCGSGLMRAHQRTDSECHAANVGVLVIYLFIL